MARRCLTHTGTRSAAASALVGTTTAYRVPTSGGAVMVINHIGYMDFTYAGLAALKSGRLVRFMAKDAVFSHPVSGPLITPMLTVRRI